MTKYYEKLVRTKEGFYAKVRRLDFAGRDGKPVYVLYANNAYPELAALSQLSVQIYDGFDGHVHLLDFHVEDVPDSIQKSAFRVVPDPNRVTAWNIINPEGAG